MNKPANNHVSLEADVTTASADTSTEALLVPEAERLVKLCPDIWPTESVI